MPINVSHCASIARCVMVINFCASRNWFCIVAPTHSVRSTPLTTISTAMLWKTIKVHWGISRCSKLFYTFSRCYFHIESAFSGASISFVLSHIARYVPSPEENSCIPITHFQCKNNFEHLLILMLSGQRILSGQIVDEDEGIGETCFVEDVAWGVGVLYCGQRGGIEA